MTTEPDADGLEKRTARARAALEDDPDRLDLHQQLAVLLLQGNEVRADPDAVAEALTLARTAFEGTAPDFDERHLYLSTLMSALLRTHEVTGEDDLLDEVIALAGDDAEESTDPDHLTALALALERRAMESGDDESARSAVRLLTRAAELGADDPGLGGYLLSLGNALLTLYEQTGEPEYIRQSADRLRAALDVPPHEVSRSSILSSLSLALGHLFEIDMRMEDLEESVEMARLAVDNAHGSEPGAPGYSTNLAYALLALHNVSGNQDTLDQALDAARSAVRQTTSRSSIEGVPPLECLGNCLCAKYEATGELTFLDGAIAQQRSAVRAARGGGPLLAAQQANLAISLCLRHEHTADKTLLQEAEDASRDAIGLTAEDDIGLPLYLQTLARALRERFEIQKDPAVLDQAIDHGRRAVALQKDNPVGRSTALINLSADLVLRGRHHGDRDDFAEATDRLAEARSLGSPDAVTQAMTLYDLGLALWDTDRGTSAGPAKAISAFGEAAAIRSAPPLLRAESALEWGRVAAEGEDWAAAAEGFAQVVELLPWVAPRHLDRGDQEHLLAVIEGAARDSVACAIRSGTVDLSHAVSLLERGRDVLFAATAGPGGDLETARAADPDLVGRFEELWARLISHRSLQYVRSEGSTVPELGEQRSREAGDLVDELDETVAAIRRLDGLTDFLRPPLVADLLNELASRTVAMINVSQYGCDALILRSGQIAVVPLPDLPWRRLEDLVRLHRRVLTGLRRPNPPERLASWLDRALREICGVLWTAVAQPVLDAVGAQAPRDGGWPRLWWCPTGPLSLLPIHAAHPAHQWPEPQDAVLDRVIPSMTPTLRSLAKLCAAETVEPRLDGLLVVAPPVNERSALHHADREISAVERFSGVPTRVIRGSEATRTAVVSALAAHRYLHYVGHSVQDLANPGLGGLCLSDGDLTGLELAALRLPGASMAYLSSCEGVLGGTAVPDEPLTIALGLRSAGFRHVVGALWAVDDQASAEVAEAFYRELTASGHQAPDPERAATALHATLLNLRDARPPAVWAAYMHLGA